MEESFQTDGITNDSPTIQSHPSNTNNYYNSNSNNNNNNNNTSTNCDASTLDERTIPVHKHDFPVDWIILPNEIIQVIK
jgi:hypothetical protein